MAELCIVIPTYEEAANVARLLPALRDELAGTGVDARVLVVDDTSPDGTGAVAERAGRALRSGRFAVEVLHRRSKAGLGTAYVAGMRRVLGEGTADWVLTMDADLSHDPSYLPAFLDAAGRADLVVGSRYVRGGATPDWPLRRRALSVGGNWYSRLWLGSEVTDWTGGFNLYRRQLLARCDVGSLRAGGYGFQIELKRRVLAAGGTVTQIPIVFRDRTTGTSKLPGSTLVDNLLLVPRLRFGPVMPPPVALGERPVVGAGAVV